jgi:Ser/Thr protein kinase RdoA (MazF antagonist)
MTPASAIQPPADQAPRRSDTDRAIAAAVTTELLARAAKHWIGEVSNLTALRAVQNFVYAADFPHGPSILRLTHDSYRTADEVKAELQWIQDLASRGLSVSTPLPTNSGSFVESIDSSHGRFIATCFLRAKGTPPDPKNPAQWNEALFEKWGAFIAGLHEAARMRAWTPASLGRNRWNEEIVVRDYRRFVPASEVAAREAFDRLFLKLRALPQSSESFGLTHADFHLEVSLSKTIA